MGKGSLSSLYRTASQLLEPGEIEHLEQVAAWQGRPVQGVLIDEIRRQFRRKSQGEYRINRTQSLEVIAPPVSEEEPVLDRLVRADDIDQLVQAIARLPDRQRTATNWMLAGYSQKEIGQLMGCSSHTVEHHLRKARLLLSYALAGNYR
jgi:RNA polymerase sigma factor (sigma-70 family)